MAIRHSQVRFQKKTYRKLTLNYQTKIKVKPATAHSRNRYLQLKNLCRIVKEETP